MHNFRELKVWQQAMSLAKEVYLLTDLFPPNEKYGLTAQVRRCAVSISSNIAEGASRPSTKAFARFIDIAIGSCYEMETQLLLSISFNYIEGENAGKVIDEIITIQKMLHGLKNTIINKEK